MAKRFTDSEKWKKQYFKSLSTVNKLFFLYILDDCDHAGIWHYEPEIAEIRMGEKIDTEQARKELGKHIHIFDEDEKWFIPSFIEFQYGTLNESVNAHKSVINKLNQYKLTKIYQQFINCSSTVKDKDMDKDTVKDKDKDKEEKVVFDYARVLYPGSKRGLVTEFDNFRKKHNDWKNILFQLTPRIEYQIKWREDALKANGDAFIPEWKMFSAWINQKGWEIEMGAIPAFQAVKTTVKMCVECGGINEEPPTVNPRNDICPICTANNPDDYFLMHDIKTAMEIINEI